MAISPTGDPTPTPTETATESPTETPTSGTEPTEAGPDEGPLPVDPDVLIGELDNGLTYYIRTNSAPGERLELRLVVDAGSLQQPVARDGSAHFLEHMLFNGTEMFPGNELDDVLSALGAEIGPDLNAYTSYDETVYFLSLPADSRDAVETGFDILLEWADRALIDPDEVVAERGVVREEVRLSAQAPGAGLAEEFDDAYYGATSYADRAPGGEEELILETTDDTLREYYDSWYRPDLMAIVAVGDLPIDVMEQQIIDRFADMEPRAESPERVDPTVGPISEPDIRVITEADLPASFSSIDYWLPNRDASTYEGERDQLLDEIAALMISNRLTDAVARGETEMLDPLVSTFNDVRDMRFLGFNVDGDDLAAATEDVLVEMADILTNGFSEAELERSVAAQQAGVDRFLESSATRQDSQYADLYTAHYLAGADISAVQDAYTRVTEMLAEFTADEVSDHLRSALSESAPIIIVAGSDDSELPSVADLEAAVAASEAAMGAPPEAAGEDGPAITELMARPDPIEEIEAGTLPRLSPSGQSCGVCETEPIELVFENGVTLRFVESTIAAASVALSASSLGGWSTLPEGSSATAPLATAAVAGSGLSEFDRVSVERFLAGSSAALQPYIDESDEGFFGGAAASDIETLFQLLHLLVTEPRVDTPALRSEVEAAREESASAATDPDLALDVALNDLRYRSDPAHRFLATEDQLDALTEEAALDLYLERLGKVDDLVVAIAGDVDVDTVIELARSYLGTLPEGPSDTWEDIQPLPPEGIVSETIEVGGESSSGAVVVLQTTVGEPSAALRVASDLTQIILDARLFESLRESLSVTYGGSASLLIQSLPKGLLEALLLIEGDPERLPEIHDAVLEELADLASEGPDDDEFNQALAVLEQDYVLINNGTALDLLLGPELRPGEVALDLDLRIEILAQLTPANVQGLAAEIFPEDQRIDLFRVPAE